MKSRALKTLVLFTPLGSVCGLLLTSAGLAGEASAKVANPDGTTGSPTSPPQLASFTLSDQFGASHEVRFPRAKPTLIVVADRKGSEDVNGWVEPLHSQLGDRVEMLGLADVSKVPGFLRGRVRGAFRDKFPHAILLDWKGAQCRALDYRRGEVAVYVLDGEGAVRFSKAGAADKAGLAEVNRAVESLAPTNAPAPQSVVRPDSVPPSPGRLK